MKNFSKKKMENFIDINRKLWNAKTAIHVNSDFYNMDRFKAGKSSLNEIELELLGNIKGKNVLHLQCHFGQDSISLARMGANVTGVDLSDEAIRVAKKLATEEQLSVNFYCGNVLNLDTVLPHNVQYDLIFTSYGVIGWLPELKTWAKHIGYFLKKEGRLLLVEFHPAMWMFDDDFEFIRYSYFNRETIIEETEGTYADKNAAIKETSYCWNHSFQEVLTPLLQEGKLQLKRFEEFDYSPYDCVNNTVAHPKGFQIKGMEGKLPMVYALEMLK